MGDEVFGRANGRRLEIHRGGVARGAAGAEPLDHGRVGDGRFGRHGLHAERRQLGRAQAEREHGLGERVPRGLVPPEPVADEDMPCVGFHCEMKRDTDGD